MDFNYAEVVADLKKAFVKGTVQFRSDNGRPYIPNQVYTDRVEAATNSRWSREIKELEINTAGRFVKAIVRIHIGAYYRDGYGFCSIEEDSANHPKKIANAVDKAVNEALLEAFDSYEMGWRDLAPYKKEDWAGNPALRHLLESDAPPAPGTEISVRSHFISERTCIFTNCGKRLTREEWDILGMVKGLNRDKMTYCYNHLRPHYKKLLPEELKNRLDHEYSENP
ncbi:hypothetical protein ACFPYJ_19075 [Paenibacillus solisilvae]|uniref:Uncharacterized protein n=1 Tax=Paenibacillus solisilvae TaxID=2486751 RepID=A0ABW0VZ65_9BACL